MTIWNILKLIESMKGAHGNGTNVKPLIIVHNEQISQAAQMLAVEFGVLSNIKSGQTAF